MIFTFLALPILASFQEPEPIPQPMAEPPMVEELPQLEELPVVDKQGLTIEEIATLEQLGYLMLEEEGEPDMGQEPEEPMFQDPVVEEILDGMMGDAEAKALAAWLGDGTPDWNTPTGKFLRELELGMNIDLIAEFTEAANGVEAFNDLRIRSAQLNFAAPVAGVGRAFVTFDLSDGGNGTDIVLREAGALISDIAGGLVPGQVDLRVGKYLADLGAWNTVFANEFPAPSLDGVRRSFMGGNLVLSGVEMHHLVPFDNGSFRWSLGIAGDSESQDVDSFGNGLDNDPAITPSGRRGAANWTGTARGALQFDLGGGMRARLGASGLFAPNEIVFTNLGAGVTERGEVDHSLIGFDAGFLFEVPDSEMAHELSIELWLDDNEYRTGVNTYQAEEARGEWMLYQFTYNPQWSAGALVSRNDVLGLSALDLDASYHSGFLTYALSEKSTVTMFLTHTNPQQLLEKYFTVGLQLTMDLGASRNNAIPRWN